MVSSKIQKHCVLCADVLTVANDSEEHVIPNSIGGRKKVKGFICRICNSFCGEAWDSILAKQLNPLNLLFKVTRQRGNSPAQNFKTIDGNEIRLNSDSSLGLLKPSLQKNQANGKAKIRVSARSSKELRTMLKGLKRKNPTLDIEECVKNAKEQPFYLEALLNMSLSFGGQEVGKSLIKSTLALAFLNGINPNVCGNALRHLRNDVAETNFGFFYDSDVILNRPQDKIFHCVAICGETKNKLLLGYIEYFGIYRMMVCLSDSYDGPNVSDIYAIDPASGVEVELQFEISLTREELPALLCGGKTSLDTMNKAFNIPLMVARKNNIEREKNRVVEDATEYAFKNCGIAYGERMTKEHVEKLTALFIEKLSPFLRERVGGVIKDTE